eukprot:403343006
MSIKKKMTFKPSFQKELNQEQQNFEYIIENAGLSKFRTLKLFFILNCNFKQIYAFDIIIPKANKAEEFAPLIEIAEREVEHFEEEENNGVTEDEFRQFVQDVYQQTLIDIVNEGDSDEDQIDQKSLLHKDEASSTNQLSETLTQQEQSFQRRLNIVDNLGNFNKVSDQTREQLLKGQKNSRLKIFQNPYCYLSVTQLTRDLLFKSFSGLEVYQLYSRAGQILEHFHEIPNSQKHAFLVDYDTTSKEAEKLHHFITNFNPDSIDLSLRVIPLIENFPQTKTKEIKLCNFKIREAFFDDDEDFKTGRKRRFRELQLRIKKRIQELFKGNPHAKIESSIPVLPQMPKVIQSAVGKNRSLFKDSNKEKAKNYNRERKDEQLKFNDIKLTPPTSARNHSPDQSKNHYRTSLPRINQSGINQGFNQSQSISQISGLVNQSSSMTNLLETSKRHQKVGDHGKFNFDEMKDFFMKHYNDTNEYDSKLKLLNLKQKEKFVINNGKHTTNGLSSTKSVSNLKALKTPQNLNLEKQLQIGIQASNSKVSQILGLSPSIMQKQSNQTSANSNSSVSTKASIMHLQNKKPIELMSLSQQTIAKNKRQIGNFLYNKSKFIRNLILSNKYLAEYLQQFSYNFDDYEQVIRYFYLLKKCQDNNQDIIKVQQGAIHLEQANEHDFSQFVTKFIESDQLIYYKQLVLNFKPLRKINRQIMDIILKILGIEMIESESQIQQEQQQLLQQNIGRLNSKGIDMQSYLKLRYFFIDKKSTKPEYIQLIANVIFFFINFNQFIIDFIIP